MGTVVFYLILIGAGIAAYLVARASRRRAVCRNCGEVVHMEHDEVQHCPSCGATLR